MTHKMGLMLALYFMIATISACKTSQETEKVEEPQSRDEKLKTTEAKLVSKKVELSTARLSEAMIERYRESLYGKWSWHKTICCSRTPQTHYAKDAEKSKSIHFSPEGIFTEFENGTVVSKEDYEVGNAFNDRRVTLKTGEYRTAIVQMKEDTLILDYGYMDLEISYYIREGEGE